jgi:two-component system, NtrC family, nitrogen regulation response regulator GlnG
VNAAGAILVVDDNPRLCELAKRALDADGWRVETATSRGDALFAAARERFSVALSDYAMPDGDGLDLLCEVERLQPHCRLLLWSVDLPKTAARKARALGVRVLPGKLLGDELRAVARSAVALQG